jgi:hypothetical protein
MSPYLRVLGFRSSGPNRAAAIPARLVHRPERDEGLGVVAGGHLSGDALADALGRLRTMPG